MNWLIWMAIGIACGSAIGYEELGEKIKLRIKQLFQEKRLDLLMKMEKKSVVIV